MKKKPKSTRLKNSIRPAPSSTKIFNKENLQEWMVKNYDLFEEEDGKLNGAELIGAAYKAFGKRFQPGSKEVPIITREQYKWLDEIFEKIDRKRNSILDFSYGKITNPTQLHITYLPKNRIRLEYGPFNKLLDEYDSKTFDYNYKRMKNFWETSTAIRGKYKTFENYVTSVLGKLFFKVVE